MSNSTNGLSIGGMVIGIVALILAIIPCTTLVGAILGLVGIILSIIGYRSAKDYGGPTGMGIAGIVLNGITLIVAIGWYTLFSKASGDIGEALKLENCDEVLAEMEKTVKQVESISEKGDDDVGLGDISSLLNATKRITQIQATAAELDCNQDSTFQAKMEVLTNSME